MVDRWLDPDTVDYSDLPQVVPPVGRAGMHPARPLPEADGPPNMPAWPILEFRRTDMSPEPDGE